MIDKGDSEKSIKVKDDEYVGILDAGKKRYLVRISGRIADDTLAKMHIYATLKGALEIAQRNEICIPQVKLIYSPKK